jgi:predicted transcriptional regulator
MKILKEEYLMTKFEAFKLRMALIRIWFIKNLIVFLELAIAIGVVLVLTGQLPESTPIVGELSASIRQVISQDYSRGDFWINLLSTIFTLLVSLGVLSTNLKRIAISDIKSKNIKRALIQAGMYFNKEGKLVKRMEEASRIDIDGDNKIGETELSPEDLPREGLLPGLRRAGQELGTIIGMKIETKEDVEKIAEKTELKETVVAVQRMDEQLNKEVSQVITNKISDSLSPVVSVKRQSLRGRVSAGVKGTFSAIGNFFYMGMFGIKNFAGKIFKKKEKKQKETKPANILVEKQNRKEQVAAAPVKKLSAKEMLEKRIEEQRKALLK